MIDGTLIDYYRAIENSSVRMLEAARSRDWDQVVHCEGVCAILIEQLREQARTERLSVVHRAEKAQIMLRILRNDAQIRQLAEPWFEQFDDTLAPPPSKLLH